MAVRDSTRGLAGAAPTIRAVPQDVALGRGCLIDDNVILGARPGRAVREISLRIGRRSIVRSGSVLYAGTLIGDGFETGHNVIIREDNLIGVDVKIWNLSLIHI